LARRRRRKTKKKKKVVLQIGLYPTQHKEKEVKLKISESSTLSLQGDVREYIDTVYYSTLHILEDLI
jgi:hypothetical protein